MCGIAGFWIKPEQSAELMIKMLGEMTDRLSHRGPDDAGHWIEPKIGAAIGHRRLSIIDLTSGGHQPMVESSGRFVISYNGEIYNYKELQNRLLKMGCVFNSNSDTEVLLTAIKVWGLEEAIKETVGMFAFALFDRKDRDLYLVRDRLGIKPLYYAHFNQGICFASEIRAFRQFPKLSNEIDEMALNLYLTFGYIPQPYCILRGVNKVEPGSYIRFERTENKFFRKEFNYWSITDTIKDRLSERFQYNEDEAIEKLEDLLSESIKVRMRSDVPYGVFLSGGIDSSTVASVMQRFSSRPINSFSIGFSEESHDESVYATKIAQHLGTNHTNLQVKPKDILALFPKIPEIFDEPFSDVSLIPMFMVSKLARNSVKVCLSGDGGDELFGGYNRYGWVEKKWRLVRSIPNVIREMVEPICSFMGEKLGEVKLIKLARLCKNSNFIEFYKTYRSLTSHSDVRSQKLPDLRDKLYCDRYSFLSKLLPYELMMLSDMLVYLPDDILTKVDRCSMAVSLEARVPILDHRIVEFAWSLPLKIKRRKGENKIPLKDILKKYVPSHLFERDKRGFVFPISKWFRNELSEWVDDLVNESHLTENATLEKLDIKRLWRQHLTGKADRSIYLYNYITFKSWQKNFQS